jgi:hypothetical protein
MSSKPSTRTLAGLTVAVALMAAAAIYALDSEKLGALGSILSGAGGLLAVIWFSAGLRYQSRQLEDQRVQFAAQFAHLQETSRRDALLLCKTILDKAEERAISINGSIKSITELFPAYAKFDELKPLLGSTDAQEVLRAHTNWMKKEGAAVALLSGIKSAAEVYLRGIGATGIDYSKAPEDFYFIHSSWFETQPFFNELAGTARMLSEFMVRLQPGRNAAFIAFFAATVKGVSPDIIHMGKLRDDMKKQVDAGYPLPEIAKDLFEAPK